MPSLKDLRNRIASVKSTQKITKAMQMVAVSKLRRAQSAVEAARPYAEKVDQVLANLAAGFAPGAPAPPLLAGAGSDDVHLLAVCAADRGLCGAFNASIVRLARERAAELVRRGKTVKFICLGKKGYDQLRRTHEQAIVGRIDSPGPRAVTFEAAQRIAKQLIDLFDAREFDVCTLLFARFHSAASQIPTAQRLIPPEIGRQSEGAPAYRYEPDEIDILSQLLPRAVAARIYRALLENAASFFAAQMNAMDNATRNAGEMVNKYTLRYNRTRQAMITKELIEIISGAEAL
ncbi:MAG TPA: F0F1 ATP synthase subunit gamma [Roseiarcus sp.]|nr:F0F1 ATP synthase subunit gamma [Roseiarcus sp.]